MRTLPIRWLLPLCSAGLLMSCAAAVAPPPAVTMVATAPPAPLVVPPPPPVLPAPGTRLTQGQIGELLLLYDAALGTASAQLCAIGALYGIDTGGACDASP